MTREDKFIEALSDAFNDIVANYVDGVYLPDIDCWHTADIVQLQDIMNSELQRRADEARRIAAEPRH